MPQWKFIGKDGQPRSLPPVQFNENGDPEWYPLIPWGAYVAPTGEYFEVLPEIHGAEMVAQFKQGFPNSLGIPADENQLHQKHEDGAYPHAVDLEIREDGLWGLLKPTSEAHHLDALPYISPNFTVGDGESPNHRGRRNIIEALAACSSPWFGGQPGMVVPTGARVMASMSTVGGGAAPETVNEQTANGGIVMTPEETALQSKIDELTQALADKDEALATKTTEIEGLQAQITERDTTITELTQAQETAKTEAEALAGRITALEQSATEREYEAKLSAAVNQLSQTVIGEGDEAQAYAPDAVQVLAAVKTAGTPEQHAAAGTAFAAHLEANGGKLKTVAAGEKPGLQVRASVGSGATGGDQGLTDNQKLELLPDADAARLRSIMVEKACGYEQAYRMDYDRRHAF